VVVFTNNNSIQQLVIWDEFCRSQKDPIKFIVADTRGVFGAIFNDFGPEFKVLDKDGESPVSGIVTSVSKVCLLEVACMTHARKTLVS
jgi:ubiquitin-activating enzyme E1